MNAAASTSMSGSLAALADPPERTMDGAAMDYFLIELVNTLRASSAVAVARTKKVEQDMIEAGLLSPTPQVPPAVPSKRDSMASISSKAETRTIGDDEDEALRLRLESIGVHVGANVAERSVVYCILSPYVGSEHVHTDYVTIEGYSPIRWMQSSSSARTFGMHVGKSRWITYAQIIGYAVSNAIPVLGSSMVSGCLCLTGQCLQANTTNIKLGWSC